MDCVSFGQRIRQARKAARMTQAELARKIGMSAIFIGFIERGTRVVSIETLLLLCSALNVDPETLLYDSLTYLRHHDDPQDGCH